MQDFSFVKFLALGCRPAFGPSANVPAACGLSQIRRWTHADARLMATSGQSTAAPTSATPAGRATEHRASAFGQRTRLDGPLPPPTHRQSRAPAAPAPSPSFGAAFPRDPRERATALPRQGGAARRITLPGAQGAGPKSCSDACAPYAAVMGETIGEILPEAARRFGDKTALVVEAETFSFSELEAMSNRVANGLVSVGVRPG